MHICRPESIVISKKTVREIHSWKLFLTLQRNKIHPPKNEFQRKRGGMMSKYIESRRKKRNLSFTARFSNKTGWKQKVGLKPKNFPKFSEYRQRSWKWKICQFESWFWSSISHLADWGRECFFFKKIFGGNAPFEKHQKILKSVNVVSTSLENLEKVRNLKSRSRSLNSPIFPRNWEKMNKSVENIIPKH